MIKKTLLYSMIATTITVAPVMAQSQIDNNQPVQGALHSRAAELQNKLNASYKAGYLSSTELASMQRDLDGLLVKADRKSTKEEGLTDSDFDGLRKDMDEFENRISAKQVSKGGPVSTPKEVIPAIIPGAVPLKGNQSSIIQPTKETYIVPNTTKVVKETVVVPSETVVTPGTVVVPSETVVTPGTVVIPTESVVVPDAVVVPD